MNEIHAKVIIAGGSFGGVAAALACARGGSSVALFEETNWIGGQATAQGVPPDEHPWIEKYGCTETYRTFRDGVRNYYRHFYPLSPKAAADRTLNPGAAWVSALSYEPRVGLAVLEEMLAPYLASGLITILYGFHLEKVDTDHDRVLCAYFSGHGKTVAASGVYFLDATETGEMLPLAGMEYTFGAESREETGEPLALDGAHNAKRQQGFTHLIAVEYFPGENHVIDKPEGYEKFRDQYFLGLTGYARADGSNRMKGLFAENGTGYRTCIWNFRRAFCASNFSLAARDITMLMSGNEYKDAVLLGESPDKRALAMDEARRLSLSLLHYFQTECPDGYEGKPGFPGLKPCLNAFGTMDGLAPYPYIRESNRILAEYTVREQDFNRSIHPNGPVLYEDSVGLGGYRIDIHETNRSGGNITLISHGKHWTQQIPLGALIPVRMENLFPACKNIGVTHVTNGAFRLHPVEWNIGEAVGALCSFALRRCVLPRAVRNNPSLLKEYQHELLRAGVELEWPRYEYGRSYFSHYEKEAGWYFGEAAYLDD